MDTGFAKRSCSNKKIERDDDSKKSHRALSHELDASRMAAAPDYCAVAPRSGVARERQPEAGRQQDAVVGRDFRTRGRQILHDALACREATFEGDPSGLAQRFARATSLPQQALKTVDSSQRIKGFCVARATFHLPSKRDCRRLARPRKRHYTFARRHRDQFATVRVRRHPKPKALICRVYLFATKARCRDRPVVARRTISLPSSIG